MLKLCTLHAELLGKMLKGPNFGLTGPGSPSVHALVNHPPQQPHTGARHMQCRNGTAAVPLHSHTIIHKHWSVWLHAEAGQCTHANAHMPMHAQQCTHANACRATHTGRLSPGQCKYAAAQGQSTQDKTITRHPRRCWSPA
jgi:hypothetical protein